jgi:hypothetical protein
VTYVKNDYNHTTIRYDEPPVSRFFLKGWPVICYRNEGVSDLRITVQGRDKMNLVLAAKVLRYRRWIFGIMALALLVAAVIALAAALVMKETFPESMKRRDRHSYPASDRK